ncbi:MAG: hypothetical protein ACSLFM_14255 [Tepidiformaceae bacterium]
MAEFSLPQHVVTRRRDGKQEVVLHRSMAVISPERIDIKSARSTVVLPLIGVALAIAAGWWMAYGPALPIWGLLALLLFCLAIVPLSVMSLISSIIGADVVIDSRKGSATWQQGYLGMGIGTKELVPFHKIDHLEVTIEGDKPDRWHNETDTLRQFALILVKQSGKRLTLAQVPVPEAYQEDGMDRILAVAHAIAALVETSVTLPEGWALTTIDLATGIELPAKGAAAQRPRRKRRR